MKEICQNGHLKRSALNTTERILKDKVFSANSERIKANEDSTVRTSIL